MAKLTTDELIEAFKELTLIELSEFVKAFEETFDVKAAAPAAVAVAAAPATRLQPLSRSGRRSPRLTMSKLRNQAMVRLA